MEGYKNKELSFQERAVDLVSRMSLEEKVSQVGNVAAAIPRLDVPAYNYWSEASHGLTGIFRTHKMDVTIFPVCLAKTQYSLSDDPDLLGRPEGFTVNVREMYVSAGAGFVVVLTGAVMTMPGLPKEPAAVRIDVSEDGVITGLF